MGNLSMGFKLRRGKLWEGREVEEGGEKGRDSLGPEFKFEDQEVRLEAQGCL
jgi:hypothetical protein